GVGRARGADQRLGDAGDAFRLGSVLAAVDLPAGAHYVDAVRILVVDGEEVEDVAIHVRVAVRPDAAAGAQAAQRGLAGGPVDHVEVVDVLLVDVVAAQPGEVLPVVDRVVGVGHALLAGAEQDEAGVPVARGAHDVADGPAVNAFHRL